MSPTNSARQEELQNDPYWSKIQWKLAEILSKLWNWKSDWLIAHYHTFNFVIFFISQPIFNGFCFNMGHFEAGQCHIRIYSKFEYNDEIIFEIRIFKRPIFFGRSNSRQYLYTFFDLSLKFEFFISMGNIFLCADHVLRCELWGDWVCWGTQHIYKLLVQMFASISLFILVTSEPP